MSIAHEYPKPERLAEWESVMKSFRLTEKEMTRLAEKYPTPFVVVSLEQVAYNYRFLREHMPMVNIFYAMKANPSPKLLETMVELGASFDTASAGEIETLHRMGVSGERMIYANPVKTPVGLRAASNCGVRRFTFDDASEIPKMAEAVPGAEVLVRIRVKNAKALVDLNAKFGADPAEAVSLLKQAKDAGLCPAGIAFHVGSQSLSAEAYVEALLLTRRLFDEAEEAGMHLTMLDIGGGFPIPGEDGKDPCAVDIMDAVERQLERLFPETSIWSEPGRFICGTAVNLVTSVIGEKVRNGQQWYVLDEGLYGTFSGAMYDHWRFEICSYNKGPEQKVTLLGPSCDSIDFVKRDVMLPKLSMGELSLVPDCGSYTTASATTFNGFAFAQTVYREDEPEIFEIGQVPVQERLAYA